MYVFIFGVVGMIGWKLVDRLVLDLILFGKLFLMLILVDVFWLEVFFVLQEVVIVKVFDFFRFGDVNMVIVGWLDLIFYFVVIVFGEVEVDFDKGYVINLDGICFLFELIWV